MEFVVCINSTNDSASLEVRKIYQVLPDPQAKNHQMIRVIDESGEDYLYPSRFFMPIEVSESLQKALATCF